MTDEKPPKIRGKKDREAAYRQGFQDGLAHAVFEIRSQNEMAGKREEAMADGLAKLAAPVVKRRHRRKTTATTELFTVTDGQVVRGNV